MYNRRSAIRKTLAGLLAVGAWPGSQSRAADDAAKSARAFRFIVINDTHLESVACEAWLDAAVSSWKSEAPELILHAGDVTNFGTIESLTKAREILARADAPVYVVPGNHDYLEMDDAAPFDQVFPGMRNFAIEHGGWRIIGLDTTHGQRYEKVRMQPATFQWLDQALPKLDPALPTVLFTHFPLGPGVRMRSEDADALLERFLPHNLVAAFSGHFHGFTETKSPNEPNVPLVTGRCCALVRNNHDKDPQKGWWQCEARRGQVIRTFVPHPMGAKTGD